MENILVIGNSCNQTIIKINSFLIQSFAGIHYNLDGALNNMTPYSLELLNEAFTLVTSR